MEHVTPYLAVFFLVVAIIYSSVGFGGGSSYLAILVIAGADIFLVRSTALMCNIVVTLAGTIIFYQRGHLEFKKVIPLVIASIPMAFVGGYLPLKAPVILIMLGFSLSLAATLMWFRKKIEAGKEAKAPRTFSSPATSAIGGGIGLLSGMVGIGGGIFLAPLLHMVRWDGSKKIAATASFFILVNSIAGLLGQWIQHPPNLDLSWSWPLLLTVFLGGQVGSRLSALKFNSTTVRKATAVLIWIAGLKILNDHLFHLDNFFNAL